MPILSIDHNLYVHGIPHNVKGWEVIRNFPGRVLDGVSEEEWFWLFEPFSKLKTTFSEYWTLTLIKISMTCLCKEYEV